MDNTTSSQSTAMDAAVLSWAQELAPHGIVATDSEFKVQIWNRWLENHSGLAAADVIGRSLLEIFPQLATRRLSDKFDRALEGEVTILSSAFHGHLLPFPSTVPEADFEHMRQAARIGPLILEGKICGTITTIEDVTERDFSAAQARRQQGRDQLLSWALAHLLRLPDPESFLPELFRKAGEHLNTEIFFNYLLEPGGQRMRLHSSGGLNPEQEGHFTFLEIGQALCGHSAQERKPIIVEKLQECSLPQARIVQELGARSYVCHPLIVSGNLIGTLSFASLQRDRFTEDEVDFLATIAQYVAVAIDRTRKENALVAAQKELEEHAHGLEEKVEDRTSRLTETISDLEGFCYTVSHDLRAPIRHIASYVDALREETASQLPPSSKDFLNRIEASARRMDLLTRDLLRYSKISREDIKMESINVAALLDDIIYHTPALQAPGIVTYDENLHAVLAHPSLLQQCLSNLLENAVKFVPSGISPRIVVRTENRGSGSASEVPSSNPLVFNRAGNMPPAHPNDHSLNHSQGNSHATEPTPLPFVRIWVEDNGIGIEPKFANKIFGIFERACDPRDFQGTGIGLAIVAKGMQRMGGRCGVDPQPGHGSRFWLDLPAG